MDNTQTFTINIIPVGDHLEVTIPELGITVETRPGETKRDQAVDAAQRAITRYMMDQHERSQVKAS